VTLRRVSFVQSSATESLTVLKIAMKLIAVCTVLFCPFTFPTRNCVLISKILLLEHRQCYVIVFSYVGFFSMYDKYATFSNITVLIVSK